MVTEDEIRRVAEMMKVTVGDHTEYVGKVGAMMRYFEILDSAGVESEDVPHAETPVSRLREDRHVPFSDPLMKHIKRYRGAYVRAPGMK